MAIDLPTLSLAVFAVYLGNAFLSVLLAWSGRRSPGVWSWVGAQGLLALGTLLLLLRPLPGGAHWWGVVAGNGTYLASGVLFFRSIWAFRFDKPFPWPVYALVPGIFVTLGLVEGMPFSVRVAVVSAWATLTSFLPAYLLLRRMPRAYRVANSLTAMPFVLASAASLVRTCWSLMAVHGGDSLHDSVGDELYFLGSLITSTMTLFGYFMMTGVRAEQHLRAQDEEIAARSQSLVESSRAKDLFFSIIAHDLRGPIGGAARYARKHLLGKMSGLEEKYNEMETLTSALEKTNEFLEKLLWWSRAQQQGWSPSASKLPLEGLFHQVVEMVRSAADAKEIRIDVQPGPYPVVVADPQSVQLILGNLLSNAVKFSLPGHRVWLAATLDHDQCRICVEDEGVGMDEATLDRLFKIEDKLTTHGTSGERGSGMGLLLVKSLAERNHGKVTMESAPGQGTKATLWLPSPIFSRQDREEARGER